MKSLELVLRPDLAENEAAQAAAASAILGVSLENISAVRIRKRSLDARSREVRMRLQAEVYIDEPAPEAPDWTPHYPPVDGRKTALIVGFGPAGMFAALKLIELGIKPIVLERGKDVQSRRRDLAAINRRGEVNDQSNYCFGEGGAGTYSDGKLYTRATKRGDVEAILRTLVQHGAPPAILLDAHPHIGSNKLPQVVQAIRKSIIEAGGEVHFEARVVDFLIENSEFRGVKLADGREFLAPATILSTGHSARDIFELCGRRGVAIEAKPFAMGVRVEHPQPLIDQIQYKSKAKNPHLPAASYRLAHTVEGRGVFSFCMCPGGWIVPAATSEGEVVVNGMSLSRRDSPFANSGIVVAVETADLSEFSHHGVLAGLEYQKSIERAAANAGNGLQRAPAQRLTDFVSGKLSRDLPKTSYQPGLTSAPMHEVLPPALASRLRAGFIQFGQLMRGFLTSEAVILGVESRTSSPIRIPRDAFTLQHPGVRRLFPCGEGAGYAGGIVSAAIDGARAAERVAALP
ncbi:MAG TPA: hypothetical protein VF627_10965 [Abditibacterium sp.]|jgi:hypothetical protein